jgi:hypothetical protein
MHAKRTHTQYGLLTLLLLNVLSTAIHYWDNYVSFEHYPMPAWITQDAVWISWVMLTAIGSMGYWLYRQRQYWPAYVCLALYALTGASTPGHYFYAPLSHFSLPMNVMIWSDGFVGFALIAFLLWSSLIDRPWQRSALSA